MTTAAMVMMASGITRYPICSPPIATRGSKGGQHRKQKSSNKMKENNKKEKRLGFGGEEVTWRCASGCGACCKLDKGPNYPSPQEIFPDDPHLAQMVESMIGSDGWCKHYNHHDRTCSIYSERPFFCRVEPEVFLKLYGIDGKSFNSEACRACRDSIKSVYGSHSQELKNFNSAIANSGAADSIKFTYGF